MSNDRKQIEAEVAALARINRGRNLVIWLFLAACAAEGAGLTGFVLLADFSNRLHLLLGVASLLIYWTASLLIFALGAYVRWWGLRLTKAIELLGEG
jgi:hypothetical protein